jgi:hypothetical protein
VNHLFQGDATTGIAFDGANVWVSLLNSNAVAKM